jgi:hypothetical protein
MIQLIFPLDSIDDGRKKINNLLFTGFTPEGYWSTLNSGTTGISMEFSATSNNNLLNNKDTSNLSNNLIIGNENIISGAGGYNFIQGKSNYLASSKNSFIFGNDNNLTGLTDSFVSGENLKIYSGNNISILGCEDLTISSNTTNNNFLTLISNYRSTIQGNTSSSNKKINYLTEITNKETKISADCQFVTLLSGENNIISGDVKNVLILGSNNKIGYNQSNSTTQTYQNIYVFGEGLNPILSADTLNTPLSGTYINDFCVENGLILNYDTLNINKPTIFTPIIKFVDFQNKNLHLLYTSSFGSSDAYTITANTPFNSDLTGIYFATYQFIPAFLNTPIESLSGSSSYFIDDYGFNNRWDIPSNFNSANTVFMTYVTGGKKYIKYKG